MTLAGLNSNLQCVPAVSPPLLQSDYSPPSLTLTGEQIKLARTALISSYPSWERLREMVSEELSENLDAIAGRRTTAVIVSTQVIEKIDHILHIALCYNGT
ncbi:MAG: hypothetical protein KDD91_18230 [Caldilinea sp.]|nr:hypothetical protein [Caldilinea sp.]